MEMEEQFIILNIVLNAEGNYKMRLIDADELMEHVWRDRLDSRERIVQMIENAPTVDMKKQVMNEIDKIVEEYYRRK